MIDVMIDLETWGTDPGDDIRSIGACVFDRSAPDNVATMQTFYRNVWGGEHFGLTRNPSTVEWWAHPDRADASAMLDADRWAIQPALIDFYRWIGKVTVRERANGEILESGYPDYKQYEGLRLWSHGENMDEPILRTAYQRVGLPVPWHYRSPRDTRTILEAAGMDPHTSLRDFTTGTHHNALDDAICQARAVCEAFRRLDNGYYTWRHT